jgi:hypothetical protein
MGDGADATAVESVAIGSSATTSGDGNSVAIGRSALASGWYSNAFGFDAHATGGGALAIGKGTSSGADSFSAMIANASTSYGASGSNSVAIGREAKAAASDSLALGWASQTSGNGRAIAIGYLTHASDFGATALGYDNDASGDYSTAIGRKTNVTGENSVGIGYQAGTSVNNQVVIGGTTQQVKISNTYTLPTSDGTNGQVLTTNGSGAVTFADAGGGGGADLYVANESSPAAQPTAAGANAIGIGDTAQAAGADGVAIGLQSYARAQSALGLFGDAQNVESVSIGKNSAATADGAVQLGRNGYATAVDAVSLGKSRASGADSFAAAIGNNSSSYGATGTNSVAIGRQATATGTSAHAFGSSGVSNIAGGNNSFAQGANATASGNGSVAMGSTVTADGYASIAKGAYADVNGVQYRETYGFGSTFQRSIFVLQDTTSDATATILSANGNAAAISAATQIVLPNNSAYSFSGTIVARQQAADGTACAAWKVEGLIRREGSAGTTTLVGSTVTAISNTPSWGLALSADTTNGGLKIEATGAASTDIRWVATIHTSEVIYA